MCIQLAERASDILWINEERRPLASKMYIHAEFVWQEKRKLKEEFDEIVENSLIKIMYIFFSQYAKSSTFWLNNQGCFLCQIIINGYDTFVKNTCYQENELQTCH